MSEIYIVWAKDADKAQARFEQITRSDTYPVIRRGEFALIQAEDIDHEKSLSCGDTCHCIVFEMSRINEA